MNEVVAIDGLAFELTTEVLLAIVAAAAALVAIGWLAFRRR